MNGNLDRFMNEWRRIREHGALSYVLTRGLLIGGSAFALVTFLIDTFVLEKEFSAVRLAVRTALFGLAFGALSWNLNERKFKKLLP